MSLTNQNNRSIHTDHKRIAANLARHAELTAKFMAQGMTKEEASKKAFKEITK